MKHFYYIFLVIAVLSCKEKEVQTPDAQAIVDKAIELSGGEKFDHSIIAFSFRDKHYKAIREGGSFQLERHFKDSLYAVKDVLSNTGFSRFVNNEIVKVPDSMIPRYSASVNSVHYFSVLPYGLNAEAVNKKWLGEVTLKGKKYQKIKVTFSQDGGGEDYEDVFVYWIDNENYKVDYLAYSYNESSGRGFRFREAYNERYVNGIRFVDYNNYKPKTETVSVEELDVLFETNQLSLLSKIKLKNITVD